MPKRKALVAVTVGLASLAIPTVRFGRPFLIQFFNSPFQFFILPLWLIALVGAKTGVLPAKSGPSIRRDEEPERFAMNLRYCVLFGAVGFLLNLCVSWQVMSRR